MGASGSGIMCGSELGDAVDLDEPAMGAVVGERVDCEHDDRVVDGVGQFLLVAQTEDHPVVVECEVEREADGHDAWKCADGDGQASDSTGTQEVPALDLAQPVR